MAESQESSNLHQKLDVIKLQVDECIAEAQKTHREWQQIQEAARARLGEIKGKIKLNIGGKIFATMKTTLMRFPLTVFSVMLSTKIWVPEDGVYFFDRNPIVFDHVLDYLAEGNLLLSVVPEAELARLKEELEFFHIPYTVDSTQIKAPDAQQAAKDSTPSAHTRLTTGENAVYNMNGQNYQFVSKTIAIDHPQHKLIASLMMALDSALQIEATTFSRSVDVATKMEQWKKLEAIVKLLAEASKDQIQLDFRAKIYSTCKSTLLRRGSAWYEQKLLKMEKDTETGAYFIDRNSRFVDVILDYMRTGTWKLDGFDEKLIPALQVEVDYFLIKDSPKPPQPPKPPVISWDPQRQDGNIQLSADQKSATSNAGSVSWQVVLGTAPVKYIKYQCAARNASYNCMVGLAPPTRTLSGGQYGSSGYYIDLLTGNRYSQQGNNASHFGRALNVGETIEFKYDKSAGTISVKYGNDGHFQQVWANVGNADLTAAVELSRGPHTITIVASEQ